MDALRMEQNLQLTGGLIVTERVALALGGGDAHDVVRDAVLRSAESGRTLEAELRADERVELSDGELHSGARSENVSRLGRGLR